MARFRLEVQVLPAFFKRPIFFLLCSSVYAVAAPVPDTLPPALPWKGASARMIVQPDSPWATPIEKTDFRDSPSYAETVQFLKSVDEASDVISLHTFSKTVEGRDLYYALARKPGIAPKPVVIVQGGIHAGEVDGKDAGLMMLRDIALRGRAGLLDKVDLVVIPVLNVDAHENASEVGRPNQRGPLRKGARTNAHGLDLNRDFTRLESPEISAVVKLLQQFDPALYIDVHVSDGIDYQYDITYTFAGWGKYARSRTTAGWLMDRYSRDIDSALGANGHTPDIYPSWVNEDNPGEGLRISAEGPRYSTGYGDFVGIPTVLVENHTMKSYKQRVLGTYILIEQSLKTVGRDSDLIAEAKAQDRANRPEQFMVRWERAAKPLYMKSFKGYRYDTYVSPASGARELLWTGKPEEQTLPVFGVHSTREVVLPKAWWLRPDQAAAVNLLRAHGIHMEVLDAPLDVLVEMSQMASGKGRTPVKRRATLTLPAGSIRIPVDQPYHLLAAALLEVESDDSLLAMGYFDRALPAESTLSRHLLAPLADKMMKMNPDIRKDFDDKIAEDKTFAADAEARLAWWHARSPFAERTLWTYPVLSEY